MAYPEGLPTKTVSFGQAVVLESGMPLAMRVTIKASRTLIYRPTGSPLVSTTTLFTSTEDGSRTLQLPITDSPDMGTGNGQSIVLGPNEVTHTYTAVIDYLTSDGSRPVAGIPTVNVGPFSLPSSTPGVVDLDDLLSSGNVPEAESLITFATRDYVDETVSDLEAGLSATYASREISLRVPDLAAVDLTTDVTLIPIEVFDGYVWAVDDDVLKRSDDDGATWATVATLPAGSVSRIIPTSDGEVVLTNGSVVWKSSGWTANPATATYSVKVTKSAPAGVGIRPWGFAGDGQKFIVTEYSSVDYSESRYVWASTDAGTTWTIIFDKTTADVGNTSHMHAVEYDPWADRWWLSHGHGVIRGTYWSPATIPATWTMLGGDFQPDAAPTTLTATDDGIVCGSDSGDGGLYGIPRTEDPAAMTMRRTARWRTTVDGVAGYAERGYRDPRTGLVYVCFKSDHATVSSSIAAGDARTGRFIWQEPTPSVTRFPVVVVSPTGALFGTIDRNPDNDRVTGQVLAPGAPSFDDGNVEGGMSGQQTSVAVGTGAATANRFETVVGVGAGTTGVEAGTALGSAASADSRAVALGASATAGGADSVALGYTASSPGVGQTALGSEASCYAGGTGATAVGTGATAGAAGVAFGQDALGGYDLGQVRATAVGAGSVTSTDGSALGHAASAGGIGSVALGKSANGAQDNTVALGKNTATTAADQVSIGPRHLLIANTTTAAAANGSLFVEGGALKFKGGSGTVTTIAPA